MMGTQVEIKFFTKSDKFSVPDTPFNVPSAVGVEDLNALINKLLTEYNDESRENIEFDFLIANEFLRLSLAQHLEQANISTETVIEVEYLEKYPSPSPANSLNHDDWISSVHANDKWILTGSYDNTVHIWSLEGELKLVIPGHVSPVKTVQWINSTDSAVSTFVSGSQDQNIFIWDWNSETNSVDCIYVYRGHERSVDCLDLNADRTKLASGSWDKMLKIWSTLPAENQSTEEQMTRKKLKSDLDEKNCITRTPIVTLSGHNEAISAVQWIDEHDVCTASWDHTIKIWNLEMGAIKDQLVSNKSFFAMSYSPLSKMLVTGSSDAHVRLWDPRGRGGNLVKCVYSSHKGWVTCLKWSPSNEYHFISGSQDHLLKQWDTRSPKTPLFDMSGHKGNVMCCDWSNPNYMISGGDDNQLKIFNSKYSNL